MSQSEDWIFCYRWLGAQSTIGKTCFPVFVGASDIISTVGRYVRLMFNVDVSNYSPSVKQDYTTAASLVC